jgi:hypothetical protein
MSMDRWPPYAAAYPLGALRAKRLQRCGMELFGHTGPPCVLADEQPL